MTCSECGRRLPETEVLEGWAGVPSKDAQLDRRRPQDDSPLRRHFVCAAVTPMRIDHARPVELDRYCYSPARHELYAGTNQTGWALVADRRIA